MNFGKPCTMLNSSGGHTQHFHDVVHDVPGFAGLVPQPHLMQNPRDARGLLQLCNKSETVDATVCANRHTEFCCKERI